MWTLEAGKEKQRRRSSPALIVRLDGMLAHNADRYDRRCAYRAVMRF
jgi:hypothetical protein